MTTTTTTTILTRPITVGHINVINGVDDLHEATHLTDDVNDFDMIGLDGPVIHVTAILQAVDSQLRQRNPEVLARARFPHLAYASIDTLLHDPFFTTVFRDLDNSVVRFPTGIIASCLTPNLDRARAHFLNATQSTPTSSMRNPTLRTRITPARTRRTPTG